MGQPPFTQAQEARLREIVREEIDAVMLPALDSAEREFKRLSQAIKSEQSQLQSLQHSVADILREPTPINRVWFWQADRWMAAQPGGGMSDHGLHWWNPLDWGLALKPRVRAAWKDGDSWMVAL